MTHARPSASPDERAYQRTPPPPIPRQVKPKLLDLFERYYVPLGPRVVPCLPGLVLALLSAMEDVGSEYNRRAVKMLDALTQSTPTHAIMGAVWGRLLHRGDLRASVLG